MRNRNLIQELQDVLIELFKDHDSNKTKELDITIRVKDLDVVNNGFSKALCEIGNAVGLNTDNTEPVYYTRCTMPGLLTIKLEKDDK